jgi:aryl-alcohol dehydrogenase-like predicted oxidoreductase
MMTGAATVEATAEFAQAYPAMQFQTLGETGWRISQAGFGCYRVSAGVEPHGKAMLRALASGINLIDTSTNYADGDSERLVGRVLKEMVDGGAMVRQQVVVVSKVGYLQGVNFQLSQERRALGRPFPDLVPYGKGIEHCIHPEFIADQLDRSLDRLQLETLDALLLHNPEYFLGWAQQQDMALEEVRDEFYERIAKAFKYLEELVQEGKIQCYGISSNTFPAKTDDAAFVSLDRVLAIARDISAQHHFRVVQFPMNAYEPGAVVHSNQPDGRSLIDTARHHHLGVLINRPLNAFAGNRLLRLADVEAIALRSDDEIIAAISAVNKSEAILWRKRLPALGLPTPLYQRIKDQAAVGAHLKHYWRNFGSYDRWRQFKDGILWPRLQGVFDYLGQHAGEDLELKQWIDDHRRKLMDAAAAVESLYVAAADRAAGEVKKTIRKADPDWDIAAATLSQLAIRILRSTSGVSSVLVGMRHESYVKDVMEELQRPASLRRRRRGWQSLSDLLG